MIIVPIVFATSGGYTILGNGNSKYLSGVASNPYSENLALYITSAQSLWKADLSGGSISLGVSVPASVSAFTVSLYHYDSWSPQYEVFTRYGFGYLGPTEPMPNETLLSVNTASVSDANSLAAALGQKFGLDYVPFSSNSSAAYTYISPIDFTTVMHIYFWNLLPHGEGGFANLTTEQAFESQNLAFYDVAYAGGSYSISYGGVSPLSGSRPFSLYSQLGISGTLNYSSASTGDAISVHVLGGLVTNSSFAFSNYYQNFSSVFSAPPSGGATLTVPDLNASLDFSFPTVIAYRQISPLDPSPGSSVSVSVTVKDVSPAGSPPVNVSFADNWYTLPGFNKTGGSSSANFNLSSSTSKTTIYFVKVPTTAGNFSIPATPVDYSFRAANSTLSAASFLNSETMLVGATSNAALEAIQNINSTSISSGQQLAFNVFVKNWGPGPAVNVTVAGHAPFNLSPGGTQNYTVSAAPTSLTQTNATSESTIVWSDSTGSHNVTTNAVNSVYSFGNPGSPGTSLSKFVAVANSHSYANVTLELTNTGVLPLTNITVLDPIPSGMTFSHSIGNVSSSIITTNSPQGIFLLFKSVAVGETLSFRYNVTIGNPGDNYIVLPANVSSLWNGETIVHYSQGAGLPLGVVATKSVTPASGFQGTSSTENIAITNRGSLPIYDVSFANSTDSFLSYSGSQAVAKSILSAGDSLNATLNVNMTGTPGRYNSSASAAAFIFAGANKTAPSNVFSVTIYRVLSARLSTASPRIEENHDINVNVTISNPSNVTVSNVLYNVTLPPNLKLKSPSVLEFQISSLGPGENISRIFTVSTTIPYQYTIPGGNLTFQYQDRILKGTTSPLTLNIADDLLTRYAIPIVIGLLIVIGTVFYVRRLAKRPTP